ncbi:hypothetical protein F220043C3_16090 [Enterocloster asparagiformis]|uniref:YARHG domain-containing protein n=1 Tax=Enterocloster asparagiformis TaxID=333367 RepID=UPI0034B024EA
MNNYDVKGILMKTEAPFENAMEPLDKGYYILGGIGLAVGFIRSGVDGAALLALLGLLLWWIIKANIALAKWRKLRTRQFHMDKQLPGEELFGRLAAVLTPYGLRVDSLEGMPSVIYKNIRIKVVYNENGTFSLPWSQNPGFFLFDHRYITSYLNTVAIMSIVAYHVQNAGSAVEAGAEHTAQRSSEAAQGFFPPVKPVKKRIIQSVVIGVLALITVLGLAVNGGDKKYIDSVKHGSPVAYPQITYGEAFENFFKKPRWRYFKSEAGDDVVEFSGRCMFQDTEVEAVFQFILSKDDDTFEIAYLGLNDIPQNQLVILGVVSKAFEEYGSNHGGLSENTEKDKDESDTEEMRKEEETEESQELAGTESEEFYGKAETETETEPVFGNIAQESDGTVKPGMVYGIYEYHDEYMDAAAEIGWNQEKETEYIYLSGVSKDGRGAGEFSGDVVSSSDNNYTAVDTDGNVIDFYHNGIDTIEIQNDANSVLYGLYFPGFNGTYRKTEELSPTANIKEHGDVGDTYEGNYIIPYSDIQSIAEMGSLAENMTSEDLRLAKNEIYARHGRRFKDSELQAYFDSQPWYNGTIEPEAFDEGVLNEIEKDNIKILNSLLGN